MMARPLGLTSQNGLLASVARYWHRSYASDYIGLTVLLVAYMLILFFVEPFHRMFSLDNINLQYPHAEVERVSVAWLFIYAGAFPLLIIALWAAIFRFDVHKAHVTILGLFISLLLTSFITDIIKNAVGRPRPDLIARCQPSLSTPPHTLVTHTICTAPSTHILHDGWRSFPSGHSSFAFSGLGYLSLFLSGQLHVFRPRPDLSGALFALAPMLAAALIAISRCEDYRHDVYDVVAGSALGFAVARYVYGRYYPGLRGRGCEVPFANPAEGVGGMRGRKDEERGLREVEEFELEDVEDEEGLELSGGRGQ